jgi:hypothetical protein
LGSGSGTTFAKLDGKSLQSHRVASGPFTWRVKAGGSIFGIEPGRYDAASIGLWVYLPDGLSTGRHVLRFGGRFPDAGFQQSNTYVLHVK